MPPVSPDRISLPDRYRVVRHLANGGMASVWEAHDELLDRDVAVKLLASHLGEDDRARKRFQREARAAAGLSSHPNVVTIYDVGEHKSRVFMVMEIMRGGTLGDRLKSGKEIPHEQAVEWLGQAAAALDTAHDAGVVHRDIKPGNLLLDGRERLAVADFGIARLAWEDQLTATGQVLGTAAYLSPEQALGEAATAASDRYALAVVAYELLTLTRPFDAAHFAAQARAHVEDPVPPASSRAVVDLSTAVDAVLERGLAKDPDDRWRSSEEFVAALERTLTQPTKPTRKLGRREKPVVAPPVPRTDEYVAPPRRDAWADDDGAADAAGRGGRGGTADAAGRDGAARRGGRGDTVGRGGTADSAGRGGRGGTADAAGRGRRGGTADAAGSGGRGGTVARGGRGGTAETARRGGGTGRNGHPDGGRRRSAGPLLLALALLAVVGVGGAIALANLSGGDDPSPRAKNTPEATASPEESTPDATEAPTEEPTADPTEAPTEEPTPEATPTAEATAEPSGEPDLDRARSLQLEGYNARRAGDFETALARSQAALEACGNARELSPCGFALFEQGAALNALGQYDAAIQALQQRLEVYGDNESGEVTKELKRAERNARKAGDEG